MYLPIQEGGEPAQARTQTARPVAIGEIQGDIGHLFELLDVLFDAITELDVQGPGKARASALAWIARDMAERAGLDFEANTPILIKADRLVREAAEGGR